MRLPIIVSIAALIFGISSAAFAEDSIAQSSRDIQGNAQHGIGHQYHFHHHHHHHWWHHHHA